MIARFSPTAYLTCCAVLVAASVFAPALAGIVSDALARWIAMVCLVSGIAAAYLAMAADRGESGSEKQEEEDANGRV
jgi:hypothetical protein